MAARSNGGPGRDLQSTPLLRFLIAGLALEWISPVPLSYCALQQLRLLQNRNELGALTCRAAAAHYCGANEGFRVDLLMAALRGRCRNEAHRKTLSNREGRF